MSRRRRIQYSLISLFAAVTVACLLLTWMVWPKSVDVVAQLMASTATVGSAGKTVQQPRFFVYQARLAAKLSDSHVLRDAATIVGGGRLAMLRGKSHPEQWLRRRLEVTVAPNSVITVKLTVPQQYHEEAIEVMDYITYRAVADMARELDPLPRTEWSTLVHEQMLLQQSMWLACSDIDHARQGNVQRPTDIARMQASLGLQINRWKQICDTWDASYMADVFVDQLRFVQLPSVAGEPHKRLFF